MKECIFIRKNRVSICSRLRCKLNCHRYITHRAEDILWLLRSQNQPHFSILLENSIVSSRVTNHHVRSDGEFDTPCSQSHDSECLQERRPVGIPDSPALVTYRHVLAIRGVVTRFPEAG